MRGRPEGRPLLVTLVGGDWVFPKRLQSRFYMT